MGGTSSGGRKVREAVYKKYGKDYYKKIGKKGGSGSRPETRAFYLDRELARQAGRKGVRKEQT